MKKTWRLASLLLPLAGVWGCGAEDASQATKGTEPAAIESTEQALLGSYKGCRGNAFAVCADLVDPHYYDNHSSCQRNPICNGLYAWCDVACPAPTALETPNIRVVAAGKYSPLAAILVGYVYSFAGGGGFYSNSVRGANINAPDSYRWGALTRGVGVNTTPFNDAKVQCDTQSAPGTATSHVSIRWANGSATTIACSNRKDCWVDVPVNGGFTAACNLVDG